MPVEYAARIKDMQDGFCSPAGSNWRNIATSEFGCRKDPFTGKSKGHGGIDLGVPPGTSVRAGLPANRQVGGDTIAGTFLIAGAEDYVPAQTREKISSGSRRSGQADIRRDDARRKGHVLSAGPGQAERCAGASAVTTYPAENCTGTNDRLEMAV